MTVSIANITAGPLPLVTTVAPHGYGMGDTVAFFGTGTGLDDVPSGSNTTYTLASVPSPTTFVVNSETSTTAYPPPPPPPPAKPPLGSAIVVNITQFPKPTPPSPTAFRTAKIVGATMAGTVVTFKTSTPALPLPFAAGQNVSIQGVKGLMGVNLQTFAIISVAITDNPVAFTFAVNAPGVSGAYISGGLATVRP
jgi:hypothetical protein